MDGSGTAYRWVEKRLIVEKNRNRISIQMSEEMKQVKYDGGRIAIVEQIYRQMQENSCMPHFRKAPV